METESLIERERKRQKLEQKYHLIRRSPKKEMSKAQSLKDHKVIIDTLDYPDTYFVKWFTNVYCLVQQDRVDIGILKIRLNDRWLTKTLMGGFSRIGNNEIIILVNDAEKDSDINPQETQQTLKIAEANLNKAEGKIQTIKANLAIRRARTRVEAITVISKKKLVQPKNRKKNRKLQ
ncbi:hypothetical protein RYX36_000215 [Vicia faba]